MHGNGHSRRNEATGRLIANLKRHWSLTDAELARLLAIPRDELSALEQGRALEGVALERFGVLLGVVARLQLLYPENPALRSTWLRRGNDLLNGASPLSVLLTHDDGPSRVLGLLDSLLEN